MHDRKVCRKSYIFKSLFAKMTPETEESKGSEPGAPKHNLVHVLHVEHAKHKDELVKDKVPELVLEMLPLGSSQFPKNNRLY